jgi:hypothetical protein
MKTVNKVLTATYAIALVALGVILSTEAKAETEYSLIAHVASKHGLTRDNYRFNEANPGLAIRAQFNGDWSAQSGIYHNSYYRTTVYAVGQYTPLHLGAVRFGAFAGLSTGYDKPVAGGLMAIIDAGAFSLTVRGAPAIGKGTAAVATIEFGYKF